MIATALDWLVDVVFEEQGCIGVKEQRLGSHVHERGGCAGTYGYGRRRVAITAVEISRFLLGVCFMSGMNGMEAKPFCQMLELVKHEI